MRLLIAPMFIVLTLTGCSAQDDSASAPSTAPSVPPSAGPESADPPAVPVEVPADCTDPAAAYVSAVESAMDDAGSKLAFPFVVKDAGLFYLAANVNDSSGKDISRTDVWVASSASGAGAAALTGSARNDLTATLPDARDVYKADAGGDVSQLAQSCPTLAQRAKNLGN